MTAEEISAALDIPIEECGGDSLHSVVHAVNLIELGHVINVAGSADPKNRGLKSTAETVDVMIALYNVNPNYELSLSCTPSTGLVALEFQRGKDRLYLQNDYGHLPPNSWRVELPTRERAYEIFSRMPHDPEFRTDVWLANVRGRARNAVPLPGSIDQKSIDQKSGERFRWSPGRSPADISPARLPSGWTEALPRVTRKAVAYA